MTTRRELANTLRALSIDAIQRANSGHPGMPMGMVDIAQVLWGDIITHNPGNPLRVDRDRFGASGKFSDIYPHFGVTADNIARHISELLKFPN
jgi:transketolase